MRPQLKLRKFVATLILFIAATAVFAQGSGKLMGTITNSKNGESITGVTVRVVGTSRGGSSDVSGKYSIPALPIGKYTIEYAYIGYATKQITDVEIRANDITTLDVLLDNSEGTVLDQVVVTGSFKKESIGALYAQQKNSALISDGISSEQIRRSPDKNTSEALRRVSGATIQDNKFVIVRGLSDRYNVAMMDGSVLPSTEANRRAFSFDIIPSNLIDKITISKTATPDLPADFAGGAVQITTKDIPDQNFVSFGVGYGYNSASTFKDFLQTKKNLQNYLGFDDGSSNLAVNFPSRNEVIEGLSSKQTRLALKSLPNDFSIQNKTALPSQTYQFSLGRVKQYENNNRFGALFSVNYRNSQNILADIKREWYEYDYNDTQYKFNTNLGVLANFAYSFGKSKISWKNVYNRNYENNYLEREGTNGSTGFYNRYYAFDIFEKALLKSLVEGEHVLNPSNDKIKWTVSWSNIQNDQPNQTKINYQSDLDKKDNWSAYQAGITGVGKDNARMFSKLDENIYSGEINYTKSLNLANAPTLLKAGVGTQYRKRNFDARFVGFEIKSLGIDPEIISQIRNLTPDKIFSREYIDKDYFKINEVLGDGDTYDANSMTSFGYAMLDQKFNDKLRIVYGVRVENYKVNLNSFDSRTKKIEEVLDDTKTDFLPSVNLTYSITPKTNFRASYYRTLARPEFRELAPFAYFDYENLGMIYGNTNLKRSSINNADLRFEIYPSAGEILSISAFYKNFKDAIEPSRYDVGSTVDVTYYNTPHVDLYGAEIEARKKLDFIIESTFLSNTTAYLNFSYVHTKIENPTDQDYKEKTRPMVGQSPYVINGGLTHVAFDNKVTVNLLYNRIGKRIAQAGGIRFASAWEAPRNVLDFQVGYKVLKNKGEFKLNAGDILNNEVNVYFDNAPYGMPNETLYKYKMGANYSLSFNYTF